MPTDWFGRAKSKRITGSRLQKIRASHFARNPLCVDCLRRTPPRIRLATQLDHVVALTNGGTDTEDNRQGLCEECHDEKTRRDLGHKPKPKIGLDGWPVKE